MHSVEVTERAVAEMLRVSLPTRLMGRVGAEEVKQDILELIGYYEDEKRRFPHQPLLPWNNWVGYDDEWEEAFFIAYMLHGDAVEVFCGTGYWPDIRGFGEGEADDIPVSEWHRAWSARFRVPCLPMVLGKATVNEWVGRGW